MGGFAFKDWLSLGAALAMFAVALGSAAFT
jgi:hypothetical protein